MILLIDNYDSFVFNIEHMLSSLTDEQIMCVRNDKLSLKEVIALDPSAIILSPGPSHPKDSKLSLEVLDANFSCPILGVCLGHQAIALSQKASIKTLDIPKHGKISSIRAKKSALFNDLPETFEVMRYHSLYVDDLPDEFLVTAKSLDDDVIMAFEHKSKPIFGVQFHPESYFTQFGVKILQNFLSLISPKQTQKPTTNLAPFMTKLQQNFPLEKSDYEIICKAIYEKSFDIVQLGGLLVLISEKSLYPDSLASFVSEILKYSTTYRDKNEMFDIVGTGGDRLKTINISTTTAFILASLGVRVAKHGNKAVTSKSGSSDALSALGVPFSASLQENLARLNQTGLAFFHAPLFHKITANVKEVRDRLKIGTVFNMLGPLLNPNLDLSYQMAGNYLGDVNLLMAQTLQKLGRKRALVVHGMDGMDEITICDETLVHELRDNEILEYKIAPEQFGFKRAFHKDIEGGDGKENAEILKATLKGELSGAKFDIVVFNAMFGLYIAGKAPSPLEAKKIILEAIASKKVYKFFENYMKGL